MGVIAGLKHLGLITTGQMSHGMDTVVKTEVRIKDIEVTEDTIAARLTDGRTISVPLVWSWRLAEASPVQRG